MKTIIFIIVSVVVLHIIKTILKYKRELAKDEEELSTKSIYELFPFLIDGLNQYCYQGKGKITKIDNKTINLYEEGSPQTLSFQYNGGVLMVFWKRKYGHQELKYNRDFPRARKATKEKQLKYLEIVTTDIRGGYDEYKDKIDDTLEDDVWKAPRENFELPTETPYIKMDKDDTLF